MYETLYIKMNLNRVNLKTETNNSNNIYNNLIHQTEINVVYKKYMLTINNNNLLIITSLEIKD